jgi:hypothetical protein
MLGLSSTSGRRLVDGGRRLVDGAKEPTKHIPMKDHSGEGLP